MDRNRLRLIIVVGLILSVIMIIPSVHSLSFDLFSVIYHFIMLVALASPFLIIYSVFRNSSSMKLPITLTTMFSLAHTYLIYVSYANPPQEFGYVGLIFAPFLEAIVAIPIALLIVFIIKRSQQN